MRALHALCLCLSFGCSRAQGDPRPESKDGKTEKTGGGTARATEQGPVILELFTSQGCSSCPPAEQLLSRLAAAGALGGRAVAPLAFHVDYWNDLGWSDPFSLPAWTERQQAYSRALGDDQVYTPELVVGGRAGVTGSNLAAVSQAVRRAAPVALLTAGATWSADAVTVTATAPSDADVWVAIWEDAAATRVTRGENTGETLSGARVVRRLERVAAAGQHAARAIKLASGWRAGGAGAFAQRADQRIVATAVLLR